MAELLQILRDAHRKGVAESTIKAWFTGYDFKAFRKGE